MNKTQQTSMVESVIEIVWDFVNHSRADLSINDRFIQALSVLYSYHKGYNINDGTNHLSFAYNDDELYVELVSYIPNDSRLHADICLFFHRIEQFDRDDFNSIYVEVLGRVFDTVSSQSGRIGAEFYTPSAITKLMAYFVNKEQCKSIFDPFCGTASIVHQLSKSDELPQFYGQEINRMASLYARINIEALYGNCNAISLADSIMQWEDRQFSAIVTCPPLGMRLTQEQQLEEEKISTSIYTCRSFEDVLLTRPFSRNNAKLSVTLLSTGFCFRRNRDYELRKFLVNNNLVDTVITLPSNILYGTSIPCILLVCRNGRTKNEPVKFINAESYFLGNRRKRVFDYERFVAMFEGDAYDVANVSTDEIRLFDYNFTPSLYYKQHFNLDEGQNVYRLEQLISPIQGVSIPSSGIKNLVSINNLSRDFIEVLLNNGKFIDANEARNNMGYRFIDATNEKYLLVSSMSALRDSIPYGINTDGKEFTYPAVMQVYRINEDLVTPEYLVYNLLNNKAVSSGCMPLSSYLKLSIIVDSLDKQKELVNKEIQHYEQMVYAEREAESRRLGVKQHESDLEHMLGSTQLRISKIISRLEKVTPESDDYQHLVKSIKDNFAYMNRVIQYNNASIDAESFNIEQGNIGEFITTYVDAWNNYGGGCFELSIQDSLQEKITLNFDKSLLTVMLDSILNNVYRHGFKKRKNYTEHNQAQINLSVIEYNASPYLLLSVSNNGAPFPEEFTIKDYISRGRYSASTGRSGLGGFHVYQVVKGHGGFLYLDSNKVWNTIVEILLPMESTLINDIPVYEKECI